MPILVQASPALTCGGPAVQGGFVVCETGGGEYRIHVDGQADAITVDGAAFIPIHRDQSGELRISAEPVGGAPALEPTVVTISERAFDIQRIDGLPPSKVSPRTPEQQAKVEADWLKKQDTWKHRAEGAWWRSGFRYPLADEFGISGVHRNLRFLPAEPPSPL